MCESRSRVALTFRKKVRLAVSKTIAESDQLRPTNSLPFIMQESGAKRPAKLLQRDNTEGNDRADTLSDACQAGDADGDVPAHQSKTTDLAQTPESSQETAIIRYTYYLSAVTRPTYFNSLFTTHVIAIAILYKIGKYT